MHLQTLYRKHLMYQWAAATTGVKDRVAEAAYCLEEDYRGYQA